MRNEIFRRWIWAAVAVSLAGGAIVFAVLVFAAPIVLNPAETRLLLLRSGSALVVFLAVSVPLLLRMRRQRFAASTAWLRGAHAHRSRVADDARIARRGRPGRWFGPTIQLRLTLAWTLATGVPLLGITVLAVGYLCGIAFEAHRTFEAILALVVLALVVGLFAILIAVRSVTERIGALRIALAHVQSGDFDARVVVDDASEIGRLQAGLNTMAAGLAERVADAFAFGTYVDRDVADHILRSGAPLQGEEVEVTMMFVDVRGFTSFAEKLHPSDVVATLNRFFERIVPLVHQHGGHVDKYAGDGLFAVFGAPRRHSDHADRALATAMRIAEAVVDEFGGALSVGVGLNSGPVVAGSVGGAGRREFCVIGDAVNVAARVESATRETGDPVLLSNRTLEMLTNGHGEFIERPGLTLKGKTTLVQIYATQAVAR